MALAVQTASLGLAELAAMRVGESIRVGVIITATGRNNENSLMITPAAAREAARVLVALAEECEALERKGPS